MILVNAHDLHKAFASKDLFSGISFGIEEGDKIGLIGPNGTGKSTLLRILGGFIPQDQGSLTKKKGLKLGYLEQNPQFEASETILSSLLKVNDPSFTDETDLYSKAYSWMGKLELDQFGENFLVKKLSGGWQKKLALARELVKEPELLLLDEPTNQLDISSILWLETFLRESPFALLMITHDRLFLQRIVNRIMDLDPRNPHLLLDAKGDYTEYLQVKSQNLASLAQQQKVLANNLRRETAWLSRGAQGRQTKQNARRNSAHELKQNLSQLEQKNLHRQIKIDFGEVEGAPQKLIEAKGLTQSFDHKVLFRDLDILIRKKTRMAIMGNNGCGKSTLIQILMKTKAPESGSVAHAENLKIAYFEQNRETIDDQLSVLRNLCPQGDYVSYQGQFIHIRSYLDRFLFFAHQADLPAHRLSGGERARLRLAQLMLLDAQILVLDEPTNDLDTDTLFLLEEALNNFPGAILLVTHDRYFLDSVANEILAFAPLNESPTGLMSFSDYWQWERWFKESSGPHSASRSVEPRSSQSQSQSQKRRERLSYKEKFELENMEENILKLEAEQVRLEGLSQSQEVLLDSQKLQEVSMDLARVLSEIEEKYQRWSELSAKEN